RPPSPRASSSACVQTPPTVSAVISTRAVVSAAIDRIEDTGDVDDAPDGRIESRAGRQRTCPRSRRPAAPVVGRHDERGRARAVVAFGDEVVERSADVLHRRAAEAAVEGGFDDGVAAGSEIPRARETDDGAAVEI